MGEGWWRGWCKRLGERPSSHSRCEATQCFCCLDNGNALVAAKGQQMASVTRHDEIHPGCHGGCNHLIIIGIAWHQDFGQFFQQRAAAEELHAGCRCIAASR